MGDVAGVAIIRFWAHLTLPRAASRTGRASDAAEGGSPRVTWGVRGPRAPFTFLKRQDFFPGSAPAQGTRMQPQR